MGIQYDGNQGLKDFRKIDNNYKTVEEYIKGTTVKSSVLREKLILEGIKEDKCERCGLAEWQGEKLSLELHHKDGNHYNNDLNNLQILCPNCHSLTQNYRNKTPKSVLDYTNVKVQDKTREIKVNKCIDCGKPITKGAIRCIQCAHNEQRKAERPSREIFKQEIRTIPFTRLGEKYGVSNKAITKWCISYNLPHKKQDIKNYSDEEWEKL